MPKQKEDTEIKQISYTPSTAKIAAYIDVLTENGDIKLTTVIDRIVRAHMKANDFETGR